MFWNGKYRHIGLSLFLFVMIGVFCVNAWILHHSFSKVAEQEWWVRHTQQVINELDLTLSSAQDAETGMRGYFLSNGDKAYAEPYEDGRQNIWAHFNNVQQFTLDNPKQQASIQTLKQMITERLNILAEKKKDFDRHQHQHVIWNMTDGKNVMDRLRATIDEMKQEEQSLLAPRRAAADEARHIFYGGLLFTSILSILALIGAYLQIRRNQDRLMLDSKKKTFESWVQSNMAQISQMASEGKSLPITSRLILDHMARLTQAMAANIYTVNGGNWALQASYALSGAGHESQLKSPQKIPLNSTLLGEAARRDHVWSIKDIPGNYLNISSSLGSLSPAVLTFIPLRFQGSPVGVVELAGFQDLSGDTNELLQHLLEPLGIGLSSAIAREKMQFLLEETQQQAEELQQQQEELRSSNEELEKQTRVLAEQQQDLEQQAAELERSRDVLEGKTQELQKTNQYKSEFLAKMSHELRTPLNSLLILSTLLLENKERNLSDQQKNFVGSIQSAGNDLLNLINDILDLSKIEARKLNIRPEEFVVSDLVSHLSRVFEPQITAKGLAVKTEMSPETERILLFSDRQRLEQILRNLLSNAIKFTESGSITLKVQPGSKDRMLISVIDSGIGIPEDKMGLIFEAFEQADGSVSRKFGGTGLGLTISRELATLLGGTIAAKSKEGSGSEFTLNIPIRMSGTLPVVRSVLSHPSQTPSSQTPVDADLVKKALASISKVDDQNNAILIIEDDDIFRESVAETTRSFGFQALEASTGEMALEILHRIVPKGILLDIKLPGMSGLGLLDLVKQMPHLRHVPVHMISALDYQQSALRMGALGYLSKPVTLDKVRSALKRIEGILDKKVKRLLIVEDDDIQQHAIEKLIEGKDVEIITSSTGAHAMSLLEHNNIDCVILDLNLPDISGFELLEKLNSLNVSLPPIVIYTGQDFSQEEEERLRRYSESIIIKGARSPERLLDEVNLFLHRMESMLPKDKQELLSQLRSQENLFQGKTVLLVDDDLRNVFALTAALESRGFVVRIAKNGFEALDSLKEGPTDIVLMDLMMPKMDGLEAIRRIRSMNEHKDLPIIALTAKAMKEDHENCIEAGANDYLPKPINLNNLLSVIRVWMTPPGFF